MATASNLDAQIDAALAIRRELLNEPATNAVRLFNGAADGVSGLVIERLGPVLIVQLHEGHLVESRETLRPAIERLQSRLGVQAVYVKSFVRDRNRGDSAASAHLSSEPWIGVPVEREIPIVENGLTFLIHPYDGFSVGLFPDQRD